MSVALSGEITQILQKYRTKYEVYFAKNPKLLPIKLFEKLLLLEGDYRDFSRIREKAGTPDCSFEIVDRALFELSASYGLTSELMEHLSNAENEFGKRLFRKAIAAYKILHHADLDELSRPSFDDLTREINDRNWLMANVCAFAHHGPKATHLQNSTTDIHSLREDFFYIIKKYRNNEELSCTRILDIGFGTGILMYALKFFGISSVGIGNSKELVDFAGALGLNVYHKNILFFDETSKDIGGQRFDIVVMSCVLDLLEDSVGNYLHDTNMTRRALTNAGSFLKSYGKFLIYEISHFPFDEAELNGMGFRLISGRENLKSDKNITFVLEPLNKEDR